MSNHSIPNGNSKTGNVYMGDIADVLKSAVASC